MTVIFSPLFRAPDKGWANTQKYLKRFLPSLPNDVCLLQVDWPVSRDILDVLADHFTDAIHILQDGKSIPLLAIAIGHGLRAYHDAKDASKGDREQFRRFVQGVSSVLGLYLSGFEITNGKTTWRPDSPAPLSLWLHASQLGNFSIFKATNAPETIQAVIENRILPAGLLDYLMGE